MTRTLIVAATGTLVAAHIAESDEERDEVVRVAAELGNVWTFELEDDPLQYWAGS